MILLILLIMEHISCCIVIVQCGVILCCLHVHICCWLGVANWTLMVCLSSNMWVWVVFDVLRVQLLSWLWIVNSDLLKANPRLHRGCWFVTWLFITNSWQLTVDSCQLLNRWGWRCIVPHNLLKANLWWYRSCWFTFWLLFIDHHGQRDRCCIVTINLLKIDMMGWQLRSFIRHCCGGSCSGRRCVVLTTRRGSPIVMTVVIVLIIIC